VSRFLWCHVAGWPRPIYGEFVGVLGEVLVSFGVGAAGWSWCDGVGGGSMFLI